MADPSQRSGWQKKGRFFFSPRKPQGKIWEISTAAEFSKLKSGIRALAT
jgi:hypothetical protein